MNIDRMRFLALTCALAVSALRAESWFDRLLVHVHRPIVRTMETTGYCSCEKCCSWERSWFGFGRPIYASGRLKGRPKDVGRTASGSTVRVGTVAADTTILPIGTLVFIPDFGWGRVEDRGGAIRGDRLDIWFDDHAKALRWGRRKVPVKIWLPSEK